MLPEREEGRREGEETEREGRGGWKGSGGRREERRKDGREGKMEEKERRGDRERRRGERGMEEGRREIKGGGEEEGEEVVDERPREGIKRDARCVETTGEGGLSTMNSEKR